MPRTILRNWIDGLILELICLNFLYPNSVGGFLDTVLPELFSDEGVDWVNWWLFEKPGLFKNSLPNEAYDEDGNIIPTDTIDDLWNLVKDYQK